MRKCRLSSCKARLPKLKECVNAHQEAGFCNPECSYQYAKENAQKLRERARKRKEQEHRQLKRKVKENDWKHQFRLTKQTAQRLANRLDADKACISCGRPRGGVQFAGGHFKTVGGHPQLAFNLLNIHGQCNQRCNCQLSGNISGEVGTRGFKAGLAERYEQALVDYLEGYHPPHHWTCDEMAQIRKEYSAEIRRLERGEGPSRDWRALPEEWIKQREQAA